MRFRNFTVSILAVLILFVASAFAVAPQLISYQGRATDDSGLPLTGTFSLTFRIYDSAASGNLVWSETQSSVNINGGLFTVLLGSVTPLGEGAFTSPNRYLSVQIGAVPELSPRQRIAAVAYALTAVEADSTSWSGIKGIPAGFADGIDNVGTGDITAVNTSGGLTGGVTSGDANISIASGGVTSTHIANGTIVDADIAGSANISPSKIAGGVPTLTGAQTFTGTNNFNNTVIFGDSTARFDNTTIAIGRVTAAPTALLSARRRYSNTLSNFGLYSWLENTSTGITTALYGFSRASTPGAGNGGQAQGVYARAESDGSPRYGIQTISRSLTPGLTSGGSYGIVSNAKWGSDVFGMYASADSAAFAAYGVMAKGLNSLGAGYGVHGAGNNNLAYGYGVWGEAYNNGWANYAGYFAGDVNVSGNILMPSLITQIDHPLDPENQILRLAGVDSPEMKTIYDGIVTTDADGEAIVVMPTYFDALNNEFRYQLTVLGEFAQAIVLKKLEDGRFTIKTDKPNLEVSWQVTGVRKDAYAKANPLTIESQKRQEERGHYLHPEAFGLTRDHGVDALRSPNATTPAIDDDLKPIDSD